MFENEKRGLTRYGKSSQIEKEPAIATVGLNKFFLHIYCNKKRSLANWLTNEFFLQKYCSILLAFNQGLRPNTLQTDWQTVEIQPKISDSRKKALRKLMRSAL